MIQWVSLVIFFLLAFAGVGLALVGMPGTFLILLGAILYNTINWSMVISANTLAWVLGLAILGEVIDVLVTGVGIRKSFSKYGLIGAVIGGVLGAVMLSVLPVIGTLIGAILGALGGAFLGEYYHKFNTKKAWKAAKAVFITRVVAILVKTLIAFIQIVLILKEISL